MIFDSPSILTITLSFGPLILCIFPTIPTELYIIAVPDKFRPVDLFLKENFTLMNSKLYIIRFIMNYIALV